MLYRFKANDEAVKMANDTPTLTLPASGRGKGGGRGLFLQPRHRPLACFVGGFGGCLGTVSRRRDRQTNYDAAGAGANATAASVVNSRKVRVSCR